MFLLAKHQQILSLCSIQCKRLQEAGKTWLALKKTLCGPCPMLSCRPTPTATYTMWPLGRHCPTNGTLVTHTEGGGAGGGPLKNFLQANFSKWLNSRVTCQAREGKVHTCLSTADWWIFKSKSDSHTHSSGLGEARWVQGLRHCVVGGGHFLLLFTLPQPLFPQEE